MLVEGNETERRFREIGRSPVLKGLVAMAEAIRAYNLSDTAQKYLSLLSETNKLEGLPYDEWVDDDVQLRLGQLYTELRRIRYDWPAEVDAAEAHLKMRNR